MDLSFTEDQTLFQETLLRFLGDTYPFARRRAIAKAAPGFDPAVWSGLAEAGCMGVAISAEDGGFGGDPVTTGLALECLARHLVVEPVLGMAVITGRLLARLQGSSGLLSSIVAGEGRVAFADIDFGAPVELSLTSAKRRLNGRKSEVLGGAVANQFLVSARDPSGKWDVALIDASAAGVARRPYQLLDGSWAADIEFKDAIAADIAPQADVAKAVAAARNELVVFLCWEAVGAMRAVQEQTAAYVRERRQFGRPLADFQAVQHKVAEMVVCCEEAAAATLLATLKLGADDCTAARALAAAKYKVGNNGRMVAKESVQLHGGMGVSDEVPIATYFKKLLMIDLLLGSSSSHVAQYAASVLPTRAHEKSAVI